MIISITIIIIIIIKDNDGNNNNNTNSTQGEIKPKDNLPLRNRHGGAITDSRTWKSSWRMSERREKRKLHSSKERRRYG